MANRFVRLTVTCDLCDRFNVDVDSAALRRFDKRIYIGLPDIAARRIMFQKGINDVKNDLSENDFIGLAKDTDGYVGLVNRLSFRC